MRQIGGRQLFLHTVQALGITLGWVCLWIGIFFVAGPGSDFVLWPLGIILGALLQKSMIEIRLRAVDRQLLKHIRLNDWVGDWIFCRPFLARLATERARLLVGEESLEELTKEEGDWTRILGSKLLVLTGFQRLVLLDHQGKWANRLRDRRRLPPLTSVDLAVGAAWIGGIFVLLTYTQTLSAVALFWAAPYFFITPYWETRLLRKFAEKHAKSLANWRRA